MGFEGRGGAGDLAIRGRAGGPVDPATDGTRRTIRTLYVFEGSLEVEGEPLESPIGAVLRSDRPVTLAAQSRGAAAIILQARPIGEPVVMGGPFVMNHPDEIEAAYRDFQRTGFGGWPWPAPDPVHSRATPRFARFPSGHAEYPEGDDT